MNSRKPSEAEFIDPVRNDKNNLYNRLLRAVSEGKITNDESASRMLYNTSPGDKKFLMLKNRLRDRLVNSVVLINKKKISTEPLAQAMHSGSKYFIAAKLMATVGARDSALQLGRHALMLAQKFALTDLIFQSSELLRGLHAYSGNKKDFTQYHVVCEQALRDLNLESKAAYLFEELTVQLARTKSHDIRLAQQARHYFHQLRRMITQSSSFNLHTYYYRIGTLYYQLIKDYNKLIDLLNQHERYLQHYPHLNVQVQKGKFALLRIGAYLYLRDYAKGRQEAEQALQLFRRGSNNWFTTMENYFLLSMQAGDFEQAARLFDQATSHERFAHLPEVKKETWKVYEAYLLYALPERRRQKTFRIEKFLNEVPIFQKDKAGLYPSILIAQVLFLFEIMDEQRLEKTLESLRIFATRNLKAVSAPRTINFIKIMRLLFNYHYDLRKAMAKIQAPLSRMQAALEAPREERELMEIISYEYLCTRIQDRLKTFNKMV
ncbi:MAG: hypothetical protein RMK52_00075 [Chitinophagales bacterium]|nr:hypothetical protein [Chitinophagales bacterium]